MGRPGCDASLLLRVYKADEFTKMSSNMPT